MNLIAEDLAVSISTAGQLVTAYALGISIGAPILTALTARLGRLFLLRLSLGAFLAGNVLALAAASFDLLLVARVLTGSLHGLFVGVAFVVAASLVPSDRQGAAMSTVIGGIAVSTVVGVPLGTLVGQTLGWQAAFVAIVIVGALALVATLTFVPAVEGRGAAGLSVQARAALAPRVLAMLGVGLLLLGAQFTALTYLAPYLEDVTGVSGGLVSAFLLAFGVASAVGTFVGGGPRTAALREPWSGRTGCSSPPWPRCTSSARHPCSSRWRSGRGAWSGSGWSRRCSSASSPWPEPVATSPRRWGCRQSTPG